MLSLAKRDNVNKLLSLSLKNFIEHADDLVIYGLIRIYPASAELVLAADLTKTEKVYPAKSPLAYVKLFPYSTTKVSPHTCQKNTKRRSAFSFSTALSLFNPIIAQIETYGIRVMGYGGKRGKVRSC